MSDRIPLKRLTQKQVRTYLQNNKCFLDPLLTDRIPHELLSLFNKVYQCSNGEVLVTSDFRESKLYSSIDDWRAELEELTELSRREPVHILHGQLPKREEFLTEISSLIDNLAKELQLDLAAFDRTLESLLIIDKAINGENQRQQYTNSKGKKILGFLIAYIGEVVRVAIDGEWSIVEITKKEWEPVIVSPNGKTYDFCIMVFDELYEAPTISFYDLALMLIEAQKSP
jgi:hypothetical protein